MRRFAALYSELDACSGTSERVEALVRYFGAVEAADAAWALQVLLGRQRRRLITGRRLRQICQEALDLPPWLFDDCHSQVGDSAETIALLWPGSRGLEQAVPEAPHRAAEAGPSQSASGDPSPEGAREAPAAGVAAGEPSLRHRSLHHWMEQLLPRAASLAGEAQARAVRDLWRDLEPGELLVVNKLLAGGLRVGVAEGLVLRALARLSGLEEALLRHRLMGGFLPGAEAYRQLLAAADDQTMVPSRPYPFCLASPLDGTAAAAAAAVVVAGSGEPLPQATSPPGAGRSAHRRGSSRAPAGLATARSELKPEESAGPGGREGTAPPLPGGPHDWLVEWKWDGIRGQLIRRAGQTFLWSRGEELIQASFPEVCEAAGGLPEGTVLDGELLVWPRDARHPAPFAQLQRRLGRRAPGRRLLQECPVVLLAYDLLERDGVDIRGQPLSQRRSALEDLLHTITPATADPGAGVLGLSPQLPLCHWSELEELRQRASAVGAEGLMLKALASPYGVGRRRGAWWKHKRDPFRLDAVLLYAQAGSGRRANLFTDYTFALWDQPPQPVVPLSQPAEPELQPPHVQPLHAQPLHRQPPQAEGLQSQAVQPHSPQSQAVQPHSLQSEVPQSEVPQSEAPQSPPAQPQPGQSEPGQSEPGQVPDQSPQLPAGATTAEAVCTDRTSATVNATVNAAVSAKLSTGAEGTVGGAINPAISGTVSSAVSSTISSAVSGTVSTGGEGTVGGAISGGVSPALSGAARQPPSPMAQEAGGSERSAADGPLRTESSAPRRQLVSFAKAYSGLNDQEILQLDRWIRSHTIERFGPVRAVQPELVFELAFEGLQRSGRHRSGIAVRFPRISRWRHDKPAAEADSLAEAEALLQLLEGVPQAEGEPAGPDRAEQAGPDHADLAAE